MIEPKGFGPFMIKSICKICYHLSTSSHDIYITNWSPCIATLWISCQVAVQSGDYLCR